MSILANLALASSLLTSNISLASNILNTPTNYDPCSISEQNIRTNSNSTYSSYIDSLINQNLYSTSNATITVLTHGMAGTSEDWLTKIDNSYDDDFSYILPFSINNSLNYTGYQEDNVLKTNIFRFNYDSSSNSTILDRLIKDSNGNYKFNENETINEQDIQTHIILIYNGELGSSSNIVTNDECYNLFEESLNTILSGISLLQEDTLPKINLIGHSRGGLVNLQYAINHKEIINNLISLGTPYSNGSKEEQGSNYIYDDWAGFYNDINKFNTDTPSGYDSMLNNFKFKDQFNNCKDYFNSYAIGFNQTCLYLTNSIANSLGVQDFLNSLAKDMSNYTNNYLSKEQCSAIINDLTKLLNKEILKKFIVDFLKGFKFSYDFAAFFANILGDNNSKNLDKKVSDLFEYLCSIVANDTFCEDESQNSIIQSDVCVNLDSQLGLTRTHNIYTTLSSDITDTNYQFTKRDIITLDVSNSIDLSNQYYEYKYAAQDYNPWVAHNFETKNPETISLITNYLLSNNDLHQHKFEWNYDSNHHYKICECGTYNYSKVKHGLTYLTSNSTKHTYRCNTCEYNISTGHSYKCSSISSTMHKKICSVCNYNEYEEHLYSLYKDSGACHISYCICGKQGTSEKHAINKITGRCVKCNIEILTPSQITKPEIQLNN